MAEYFTAFRPDVVEDDPVEVRCMVGAVLRGAGVLVEFRPHRPTVERFASLAVGIGYAVSTLDIAEFTERRGDCAPHVALFDTRDEFASANLLAVLAQVRAWLDCGRWLWTTRAEHTRSNGDRVTTLAVRDERQAAALGPLAPVHRQWAVRHPKVITTAHNSSGSALYTLSKLPGGMLLTRGPGELEWVPEVACVCGDNGRAPDRAGHFAGCPEGDGRKPDCPGRAEVIADILSTRGGYLADCGHCRWQGPIHDRRADAKSDGDAHNSHAAGGDR